VPSGLAACQPAPAMLATCFVTLSDSPLAGLRDIPREGENL